MGETKKPAAKQVSIAAFFSPTAAKKPASPPKEPESPATINPDAFKTPSPETGKRKRQTRAGGGARKKLSTAIDESEKDQVVDLTTPVEKISAAKKRSRKTPRSGAKGKAKAAAAPPRFGVSPHERLGNDDDDLDDDDEDDNDNDGGSNGVQDDDSKVETDHAGSESLAAAEAADPGDDGADDVIVLSAPSTPAKATPKKGRGSKKAAVSTTPSTMPKPRRSTSKKDKDAEVAPASSTLPSSSSPKAPPVAEPLDPGVRARVSNYQQKIDELTSLCERLSHSKAADDVVLLEIYGLGLDVDLDPTTDGDRTKLNDAWHALDESGGITTNELPTILKHFVARAIQSRSESLSELVKRISVALAADKDVSAACLVILEMEIKMLAQRTPYGARPAKANVYEDTTAEALWCWEVNNIELHFTEESQKTIKRMRKQRKRTGAQLKSLSRVVQLLHQSPIDEAKVGNEEAKIGKFVSQVESELLKAREREKRDEEKIRKEQERAQALGEKKRIEHEKQLAKEEEKRKKELEAEAERQLAEKRRKSMVSYFRSIDTVHEASAVTSNVASGGASGAVSTTGVLGGSKGPDLTDQIAKMARMDQEVSYLVKDSSSETSSSLPPSRSGASLLERQRDLVTARSGHWSSRRYRDQKLGLMKLLQFDENYRPAYYGTFSKRSRVFRRGRRPFAEYPKFDYTVDSEEEWEEEEPGESLSGADSDMDGEDEEDQLDYGDDWLAYEDEVEYVDGEDHDEDDVVMDEDADQSAEGDDEGVTSASRKRRRRRVAAENKKQKLTKLEPQLSGPYVCSVLDCEDHLNSYCGELLISAPDFTSPLMKRAQAQAAAAAVEALKKDREETPPASATTPAPKKKAKATVARSSLEPSGANVTHKPPVKRKITPQLQTATSPEENVGSTAGTSSKKKQAEKPIVNEGSPIKSSIAGWLKTPVASTSTTSINTEDQKLDDSTSSNPPHVNETKPADSPSKAPVEI